MMKNVNKNHGAASLNSVLANAQKKAELGASLMKFAEAAYANGEIREASNLMLTASAEFFSCRDDLVRAVEVNPANRAQLLEAAGAMFGAGMDANDKSTLIYNGEYMVAKGGAGSGRHAEGANILEMTPIRLFVGSLTQMKNGDSQGAAVAGHDLTITYRSQQSLGDNGRPARGYVSGYFTVSEAGKPSKFFEHTPVGPTLENAKRYAAENVADYIQTIASRSLAPVMQSAAMRSASASVTKGGEGSGRYPKGSKGNSSKTSGGKKDSGKDADYTKKASKDIADRADKLSDDTMVAYTAEAARQHEGLAKEHEILAQTADVAGKPEVAKAHREAAQEHHYAAEAHRRAWKTSDDEEDEYLNSLHDDADGASFGAADSSHAASEAEGN